MLIWDKDEGKKKKKKPLFCPCPHLIFKSCIHFL